jgi:hypothetical protein
MIEALGPAPEASQACGRRQELTRDKAAPHPHDKERTTNESVNACEAWRSNNTRFKGISMFNSGSQSALCPHSAEYGSRPDWRKLFEFGWANGMTADVIGSRMFLVRYANGER